MKTQHQGRSGGFTLIELLVVITIIAVLAGAGFAAGNAAIQKAKKVTALNTVMGIESSVNNFFNEYGTMPKSIDADTELDTKTDKGVLDVLLGYSESTGLNARGIKFLNVKEGKRVGATDGTGGLITSGSAATTSAVGLFDPWGGTFKIMLDGNYDETIVVQPKGSNSPTTLNGRRVAAWSDGADGKSGTGKATDDVISWNK